MHMKKHIQTKPCHPKKPKKNPIHHSLKKPVRNCKGILTSGKLWSRLVVVYSGYIHKYRENRFF